MSDIVERLRALCNNFRKMECPHGSAETAFEAAETIHSMRELTESMAEALQIASLELQDIAAGTLPPSGAVAVKYVEQALEAYAARKDTP